MREEWEKAEVTLAAQTRRQKGEGGLRKRKDSEDDARIRCSLEKESSVVFLVRYCVTGALQIRLVASSASAFSVSLRNLLRDFYLLVVRCLCLNTLMFST